VEAFILQEISNFCSLYFADEVVTRLNHKGRYDYGEYSEDNSRVSFASYPGRAAGRLLVRELSEVELKAAHLYVLLNCPEMSHLVECVYY
jgi:hypothetical protein